MGAVRHFLRENREEAISKKDGNCPAASEGIKFGPIGEDEWSGVEEGSSWKNSTEWSAKWAELMTKAYLFV